MNKAATDGRLMDLDKFARLFSVTEKAVRGWIAEGMPVKHSGRQGRGKKTLISLEAASRWWFKANHERLALQRAQTRLASEQADKQAMQNAKTRRDLAPIGMIKREFGALLAAICADARKMSGKLAAELEGLDVSQRKATIDRAVYGFLDRAAVWEPGEAGR